MKHTISTALLVMLCFGSHAQSNTVAGGGTATGSGGSTTFTIGQIDYSNSSGSNGSYNQGVQQPFEFFKDASIDSKSLFELSIYPNPTSNQIVLYTDQDFNNLDYSVFDAKGKIILTGTISESETIIDMSFLSPGQYHISISENNQPIESFKIIKH